MTETGANSDCKTGGDKGGLRLVDAVLKILVAVPILAWSVFGCLEALKDGRFEIANLLLGGVIILAVSGYCFWSVASVLRGNRYPEHTAIWGLAVFMLWFIAIPGFLDLLGKSLARQNEDRFKQMNDEIVRQRSNQALLPSPAKKRKVR